jgi:hypothetical protein
MHTTNDCAAVPFNVTASSTLVPDTSCRKLIANGDRRVLRPNLADLHANKKVPGFIARSNRLGSHEHAVL